MYVFFNFLKIYTMKFNLFYIIFFKKKKKERKSVGSHLLNELLSWYTETHRHIKITS